ncbi:MAG TPA: DNA/RNA non-specific endonuclease, partial [Puia sp.]|nr:DNA/RNA non-specific endonuclease [Puia sp.]
YFGETDKFGNLKRIWTDDLKLSDYERLNNRRNSPGKLPVDEAGHMFGDRFGGSRYLDNIVSQLRDLNQIEYKAFENEWARALHETPPKKVAIDVEIETRGKGPNERPTAFIVKYKIGNKQFKPVKIPNK